MSKCKRTEGTSFMGRFKQSVSQRYQFTKLFYILYQNPNEILMDLNKSILNRHGHRMGIR